MKRKHVLLAMSALLAIVVLFPPYTFKNNATQQHAGFGPITGKVVLTTTGDKHYCAVNVSLLWLELLVVVLIGGALAYIAKPD